MYAAEQLAIEGFRGEAVPNEFLRWDGETDARQLAVLLPGQGYTCDMPLFYYAEALLVGAGADVLRVEWGYGRRPDFLALPDAEQLAWLRADAEAAYLAGWGQRDYARVTLVGKSLGTLAMAHLLGGIAPGDAVAAWLTPLLGDEGVAERMRAHGGPSLVAIGTADRHHDATFLAGWAAAGRAVVVVEGADHGLDLRGDVAGSVRAMGRVVEAMATFLGGD